MPPKSKSAIPASIEEDNEEAYGKMLRKYGITIHYFCMLFSSGLWQRGKRDQDGILGFMPADIRKEEKRGQRLTCLYCKEKGATIGCCVTSCRKTFHFRCSREAGGLCQFFQEFRSYCAEHRPHQETPNCASDRLAFYGTAKSTCSICMLAVEARSSNHTLRSPCCRNAWFHRICIQRYAVSAGAYFFKCPLCNNKDLFEAEMLEFGIYIPEQDASWEKEPNAFQELLERYNCCDADKCLCPQGRRHKGATGSRWELKLCEWCGSSGTHEGCHGFTNVDKESICKECTEINSSMERGKKSKKKLSSTTTTESAFNLEDVRRQLEQRRSVTLRAQRAARRQEDSLLDSDEDKKLLTVRRYRNQTSDSTSPSKYWDDQNTRIISPSLLRDHRLTDSTPVVRIERADSEIEVNVTDNSDEDEDNVANAGDSDDSELEGLQDKPQKQWNVKGVIEKGPKKVLLVSVRNEQKDNSDTSTAKEGTDSDTCTAKEGTDSEHDAQYSPDLRYSKKRLLRPYKYNVQRSPLSKTLARRSRLRHYKVSQHSSDANAQYGSDNSSCSSIPGTSSRSSHSVYPLRSKQASSEYGSSDTSLAKRTRSQSKADRFTLKKRQSTKTASRYHSRSSDSSSSADSMGTKVRYGRHTLPSAIHSSPLPSKLGCDDVTESYDFICKNKSDLSTDVQELWSKKITMTSSSMTDKNHRDIQHIPSFSKMRVTEPSQACQIKQDSNPKSSPVKIEVRYQEVSLEDSSEDECDKAVSSSHEVSHTEVKPHWLERDCSQLPQQTSCNTAFSATHLKQEYSAQTAAPVHFEAMKLSVVSAGAQESRSQLTNVPQLPASVSLVRQQLMTPSYHLSTASQSAEQLCLTLPATQTYPVHVLAVQQSTEPPQTDQSGLSPVATTQAYSLTLLGTKAHQENSQVMAMFNPQPLSIVQLIPVTQNFSVQPLTQASTDTLFQQKTVASARHNYSLSASSVGNYCQPYSHSVVTAASPETTATIVQHPESASKSAAGKSYSTLSHVATTASTPTPISVRYAPYPVAISSVLGGTVPLTGAKIQPFPYALQTPQSVPGASPSTAVVNQGPVPVSLYRAVGSTGDNQPLITEVRAPYSPGITSAPTALPSAYISSVGQQRSLLQQKPAWVEVTSHTNSTPYPILRFKLASESDADSVSPVMLTEVAQSGSASSISSNKIATTVAANKQKTISIPAVNYHSRMVSSVASQTAITTSAPVTQKVLSATTNPGLPVTRATKQAITTMIARQQAVSTATVGRQTMPTTASVRPEATYTTSALRQSMPTTASVRPEATYTTSALRQKATAVPAQKVLLAATPAGKPAVQAVSTTTPASKQTQQAISATLTSRKQTLSPMEATRQGISTPTTTKLQAVPPAEAAKQTSVSTPTTTTLQDIPPAEATKQTSVSTPTTTKLQAVPPSEAARKDTVSTASKPGQQANPQAVTTTGVTSHQRTNSGSAEGSNSLSVSRGKIWLSPETVQSQLSMQAEFVCLSDSDDSDSEIKITGTTPAHKPSSASHKGRCVHHSAASTSTAKQSAVASARKDQRLMSRPCPIHGYRRLLRHPTPSVPAKRNSDGSLTIDLTEEKPAAKHSEPKRVEVTLSSDSDCEVIS